MYVCMCVCMCIYIYIYTYTDTHTHTHWMKGVFSGRDRFQFGGGKDHSTGGFGLSGPEEPSG